MISVLKFFYKKTRIWYNKFRVKTYDNKITSYFGSSSAITRNIVENYKTFTEETIINRNNKITELLNEHTNY